MEYEETTNYAFYALKNDFARYFVNPNEFQSLSFEGMRVNPPVSPIELSLLLENFVGHNVSSVDSDGFFFKGEESLKFQAFHETLYSVEEISEELSRMLHV